METETTFVSCSPLAEAVFGESGENVNLCFQCGKCGAGCPICAETDYTPTQLIHAIRLGLEDTVFGSKTIWLCAGCKTCTTRCPQGVDVAGVMDAVRILTLRRGLEPSVPAVRSFHRASLNSIRRYGRMFELGMMASLKLRTGEMTKDVRLGTMMLRKGKLKLVPNLWGWRKARAIFRRVKRKERELRAIEERALSSSSPPEAQP